MFTRIGHQVGSGNFAAATNTGFDTTGAGLIVMGIAGNSDSGTGSEDAFLYTDTYGNTFNYLTLRRTGTSGGILARLLYCDNPTGGAGHIFEVHGSNSYASFVVAAYTGEAVPSIDGENGNAATGPGSSIQPGSLTPTQTNDLMIAVANCGGAATFSTDTGTIIDQFNGGGTSFPIMLVELIETAITPFNPTIGVNISDKLVVVSAGFKASDGVPGGGGGGVKQRRQQNNPRISGRTQR